jgi:hypothetical protein
VYNAGRFRQKLIIKKSGFLLRWEDENMKGKELQNTRKLIKRIRMDEVRMMWSMISSIF